MPIKIIAPLHLRLKKGLKAGPAHAAHSSWHTAQAFALAFFALFGAAAVEGVHAFNHLLHLFELPQQPVDILHLPPAAGSDSLFPAAIDDAGIITFRRRHAVDD